MDRASAWALMTEYTQSDSLRRHMQAVEAAMRAYAPRFGGDPETWGLVGLLHDFDYERYPNVAEDGHPVMGVKILRERGLDEALLRAILSHAYEVTGVLPESDMEKTLVAVDELTGFIVAVALVRPSKSLMDLEVSSIKKKWKDKAFAAPVDRKHIEAAAQALGVPLDEHIQVVLTAMKGIAVEIGMG
jgi:putative nucleotidyltransferase with HDIG domain